MQKNANGFPNPINRQISTSAQYYSPAVYGFGASAGGDLPAILSFYRDLTLQADPMATGFVPMSAVPAKARNTKLFAIGILPPVQHINESQLLDRSEAISNFAGVSVPSGAERGEDEELVNASEVEEIPYNTSEISVEAGTSQKISPTVFRNHLGCVASLHPSIRVLAEQVIAEARREGIVLVLTEGIRTPERQAKLYAQGRTEPGKIVTGAPPGRSWHQYGLAFDVAMVGGAGQPTWPPGDDLWRRVGNIGKEIGLTWGGDFTTIRDYPHFEYHPGFGLNEAIAGRRPPIPPPAPVPLKADVDSAVFHGYGSGNANSFRRDLARQVDMIKVQLLSSQRAQMLAIKTALQSMANTPPLRLLVNPNKFGIKSQKIVSDGSWTRHGPLIEYWGDDQDKISGSGQVAAFYALDAAPGLGRGGPGLSRHARNFSLAWQNFQSLYLLYKNNGGMYLQDIGAHAKDVLLSTVGSVYIFYDNILYIGSFDSLNMSESDTKPFTLEYSFEFTARAAFLLETPPMFNYGGSKIFAGGRAGLSAQSRF